MMREDEEELRRRRPRAASLGVPSWALPPWRMYVGYGPTGWVAQATQAVNPEQFGEGTEPAEETSDGSGEGAEGGGGEE